MDEDFQLQGGGGTEGGDLVEAQLARQVDAGDAVPPPEVDRRGVAGVGLGREVQGEPRRFV